MATMEFMKRVQDLQNGLGGHIQKKKKKSQNLLEKAICNFNTYLLTNLKRFHNKANPGSAVWKLKTD